MKKNKKIHKLLSLITQSVVWITVYITCEAIAAVSCSLALHRVRWCQTSAADVVSLNGFSCFCCTRSFVEMWLLINKFNAEPATTLTVKSSGKQFYLQIPSYTTYICYMYCFTDRHRLWTGGLGNSFRCSCILLPVNVEHWPKTSSKMFAGFLLARLCVWG